MRKEPSAAEFDACAEKLFRSLYTWSAEGLRNGSLDDAARRGAQARADTGRMAALKRGLRNYETSLGAIAWVIEPFVPENWETDSLSRAALYQAALLYSLHPNSTYRSANREHGMPITKSFYHANADRRAGSDEDMAAQDRRINRLLDAQQHEIFPRLMQSIPPLMNKTDQGVDWLQLARDLRNWDDPRQYVQQSWARGWFGGPRFMQVSEEADTDITTEEEDAGNRLANRQHL